MSTAIHELSATELVQHYRRKLLSPVEATQAAFARIAAFNAKVNAFNHLDEEGALASARASEARWQQGTPLGLLDGVPMGVKDLVLTKGMPTRFGSKTSPTEGPWDVDAPATARLREHGAVLLGKTTSPEYGHKMVTDSPLTGITRNPWNLEHSPGGSSGGSAAAVALGMGPIAVGTDGGGSIRIPSGWSGLVGHKPTGGRVPVYPPSRWGESSCLGPMSRTVADAALMLTVVAQPDLRDWQALPPDGRDYRVGLEDGVRGLRIAYSPDLGLCRTDPEVAALTERAARLLEEAGARVETPEPPDLRAMPDVHLVFRRTIFGLMLSGMTPEQRSQMDPSLVELYEGFQTLTQKDYPAALEERRAAAYRLHAFFADYDLLLLPSMHVTAPKVPGLPPDLSKGPPLTAWVNHTQLPAASVPCGETEAGLPIGLQIVGPRYADALVLRAARAYESVRGPYVGPPMGK